MVCIACAEQGQGHLHTCGGSGLAVARAAYGAGAVAEAEPVQTFEITQTIVVQGSRSGAEYVAAFLDTHAGRCANVSEHAFTVAKRT